MCRRGDMEQHKRWRRIAILSSFRIVLESELGQVLENDKQSEESCSE